MDKTPKSNRLHIALFGRTNVGKSSFLNYVVGQDISITSDIAGTTTDVVEKTMELFPLGPVVFIDTAGLGDTTALSDKRAKKTYQVFERADAILLITEAKVWGEYEESVFKIAVDKKIPLIVIVNKSDIVYPEKDFLEKIGSKTDFLIICNSLNFEKREQLLLELKVSLKTTLSAQISNEPFLIADLIKPGETAVLVVPIDLEAPKGRLILPQVQTIRDLLDADAVAITVKERELKAVIDNLKKPPSIVVCDSQVVLKVAADTPQNIPMTTFSILFSRLKGDIVVMAEGAALIDSLDPDSKVLIAESCTHHPIGDDIGRVKIPRWLRQYLGFSPKIDIFAGRDYPENISDYDLIIHCGACMFNRRQLMSRLQRAQGLSIPITNYGICISHLQGVAKRTLAPFPQALRAYEKIRSNIEVGGNNA